MVHIGLVKILGVLIMMKNKPKIYKQDGWWACSGRGIYGAGIDIVTAYNNWKNQAHLC